MVSTRHNHQFVAGTTGDLMHISDPLPGRTRDARAVAGTGTLLDRDLHRNKVGSGPPGRSTALGIACGPERNGTCRPTAAGTSPPQLTSRGCCLRGPV